MTSRQFKVLVGRFTHLWQDGAQWCTWLHEQREQGNLKESPYWMRVRSDHRKEEVLRQRNECSKVKKLVPKRRKVSSAQS